MRIDLEQFLAMTVALGAIGAVGVGVYSTRADAPALVSEAEPMDTFGDELELELKTEPAEAPTIEPPLLAKPPAPEYADEAPAEVASNGVAGPDVESPNW